MQEDAMSETSELNDFGLLTGTVIRQPWRKLPSILKEPRMRMEYEWGWMKSLLQGFVGRLYYKFWISKKRPRPKLARRIVKPIAKELHEEMYKSYANHDTQLLKTICCNGLLATFLKALPAKNEVLSWRLVSYLSRPRVVSNRASPVPLPGDAEAAVRQVVVRIHTRQILERWTKEESKAALGLGVEAPAAASQTKRKTAWAPKGKKTTTSLQTTTEDAKPQDSSGKTVIEKDVVEYVVMQRLMRAGKEQEWKIWGLAKETSLQDMRNDKKKIDDMNEWEATHPSAV